MASNTNDSDEVLALTMLLEAADDNINQLLSFISKNPSVSSLEIRKKIIKNLTDFSKICLAQKDIIQKSLSPAPYNIPAPPNPEPPSLIKPIGKASKTIFNPSAHPEKLLQNPSKFIPSPCIELPLLLSQRRKQKLFDLESFSVLSDPLLQFDLESESSPELQTATPKPSTGDLEAASMFLDEYRKKTDKVPTKNCPEKFTIEELTNLASAPYKKRKKEAPEECEVCFSEYLQDDNISFLTCHHKFHTVCIKDWLTKKNECPVCSLKACFDFNE